MSSISIHLHSLNLLHYISWIPLHWDRSPLGICQQCCTGTPHRKRMHRWWTESIRYWWICFGYTLSETFHRHSRPHFVNKSCICTAGADLNLAINWISNRIWTFRTSLMQKYHRDVERKKNTLQKRKIRSKENLSYRCECVTPPTVRHWLTVT